MKTEGELMVSGTEGYIDVPAPWWKTDYSEERHENAEDNRRYFYQLDGEGIRAELVEFAKAVSGGGRGSHISERESEAIAELVK